MRYPISNDTLDAGDIAILGRKGTGKTFCAKLLVERLVRRGRRAIIIDPMGIWWGLKLASDGQAPGLPVLVIGGQQADLPLPDTDPKTAASIAKLILATDVSVVLDVADLKRPTNLTFVAAVLKYLYEEHQGSAVWLVLEEADIFAAQTPRGPEERAVLAEVEHLARRGRSKGFRLISITQRPARLNKDVLTQFNAMAVFALPGKHDREAIKDWLQGVTEKDAEVYNTLPSLRVGEAWVWTPNQNTLTREAFPSIATYDSSSTPSAGHPRPRTGALSDSKLAELRELMATLLGAIPRPRLRTNPNAHATAGHAVRALRRQLRLSQTELAQLVGSEQKSISRIESGRVAVSTATLERIAAATGSTLRVDFLATTRSPKTKSPA